VAVVTGAGGTLCSVLAGELARQGMAVALIGRTEPKLQAVAESIRADGGIAMTLPLDVTDLDALRDADHRIRDQWGDVSVLLNGAGGNQADAITSAVQFEPGELEPESDVRGFFNLDMAAFGRVLEVNVMGTVMPTQVFGATMARANHASQDRRGGCIINFASMTGYRALSRVGAYAAAKSAIVRLTEWLAGYLAPAGIRVNAIAPGFFLNDRSRRILLDDDGQPSPRGQAVLQHTPANRFGEAEELIGCMNWLIDDRASGFVTGVTLPVDGGFLACPGI
jgi:hypothetical protein